MNDIKELSQLGEEAYASTPPSGKHSDISISKEKVLENIKPISLRKPLIMIVGSLATQGKSSNDIDIVIRGEDFSDKLKEAIDFRLYRLFTDILKCNYEDVAKYVHIHYNNAGSYTSYIPLYELDLVPVNDFKVVEMSKKIPFNLNGNLEIIDKASDGRRIIAGYASVAVVDSENQFIPISVLKTGLETLISDPNYSNLMLVHKNIQIGRILKSYGNLKTRVDDNGLFIVAEIRKDLKIADKIWESILNGEFNGFSIGCEVILSHEECDESKCIEVLDAINIFEVSICSLPVNEKSGFVVISKSKYNDLNLNSVCCECNNEKGNMPEEENIEVVEETATEEAATEDEELVENDVVEEKTEEKTDNIQERISELEREIESLRGIVTNLLEPKAEECEDEECEDEEEKKKEETEEETQEEEEKGGLVSVIKEKIKDLLKKETVTKKDIEELAKLINKLEGGKYPNPEKYPYPKKAIEDLNAKIDKLIEVLSKETEEKELELAIKARDDKISELEKQLEEMEKSKSKAKPKTIIEENEEEEQLESSLRVMGGIVYSED